MVTLQDFVPLKPAEQKLLAMAPTGKQCSFGKMRPQTPNGENHLRADFVRFLALGRDAAAAVHEGGLKIQGAYIEGAVNLDGVRRVRPLWINDCTITEEFSFADAEMKVVSLDRTSMAEIRGDGVMIDGSLLLRRAVINGSLLLFGAEIAGSLSCTGCRIEGSPWRSQRRAADLATVTIGGNVEFRNGFYANGLIHFDDSEIGGTFDCSEGKFFAALDATSTQFSPWDFATRALKCHRLNLKGSLYLRDCHSEGEMSFSGAQIGGDIDCRNGRFCFADRGDITALRFTRIDAGGNVSLSDGFESIGKVSLNGARIRGNVYCQGGRFSVPAGLQSQDFAAPDETFSEDALSFVNAEVLGALMLAAGERSGRPPAVLNGSLDLKSAYIRVLLDSKETWPLSHVSARGGVRHVIHLDGFTYDRFGGLAPTDAALRKQWLKCQPIAHMAHDFRPQPFEQVIKVLKNMGHPEEARRLALQREGFLVRRRLFGQDQKRSQLRALPRFLWDSTVGLLIGHGYKPLRLLIIMAVVGVMFGFYYRLAAEKGIFVPRDSQVITAEVFKPCREPRSGGWTRCGDVVEAFKEYPQFNPWVYSFNVLLPVVDLYQEKNWVPMREKVPFEVGGFALAVPDWGTNGLVLTELVFGWIASLLAVAAFSGLVKTE